MEMADSSAGAGNIYKMILEHLELPKSKEELPPWLTPQRKQTHSNGNMSKGNMSQSSQ